MVSRFQAEQADVGQAVSKVYLRNKIQEIASREKHVDGYGTARWVCKPELLLQAENDGTAGKVS